MSRIIPIGDFSDPALDVYARLSERQLLQFDAPEAGRFIAESPKVITRALDAGYEPISFLAEERELAGDAAPLLARCPGVSVYTAPLTVLTRLTGFRLTRGLLCAMRRRPLATLESVCAGAHRVAVLERVMNPTNLGAIFRSAAALGVDAVLLTAGSTDPLYRRAARVSMGAVFQVPWTILGEEDWPEAGLARLRALGFLTAALALSKQSVGPDDVRLAAAERLALVLGTEGDGLAADTVARCDETVRIPMARGVDSLNVAAAGAVAFWALRRR